MGMFNLDDPIGMIKRFEVGDYRQNKLPLIYEKTRNFKSPISGDQNYAMSVKVEKDGKLFDILDIPLGEVFD